MNHSPPAAATAKTGMQRGTILRDTQAGPGLISVGGRQLPFTLEQHWGSERPPVTGARVDVLFEGDQLRQLHLVDDTQIAREMASQAAGHAGQMAAQGQALLGRALAEFGRAPLIALVALWLGWWVFDWVSVRVIGTHVASYSFWDMLKMLSSGNALEAMQYSRSGLGLWNFVALLCAVAPLAPLAPPISRHRWASLGLAAPLAFMVLQAARLYWGIASAASEMQQQMAGYGAQMGRTLQDMSHEIQAQILKSISLGLGLYLSLAAALVLAFFAFVRPRR